LSFILSLSTYRWNRAFLPNEDDDASLREVDVVCQAIAHVPFATGSEGKRHVMVVLEEIIPEMEKKGWNLREVVNRIWGGERYVLTATKLCITMVPLLFSFLDQF
jgi:hypothetical protein